MLVTYHLSLQCLYHLKIFWLICHLKSRQLLHNCTKYPIWEDLQQVNDLEGNARSSESPLFDKRQVVCSNSVFISETLPFSQCTWLSLTLRSPSVSIIHQLKLQATCTSPTDVSRCGKKGYTGFKQQKWPKVTHRHQYWCRSIGHKTHKWFPKVVFHSNRILYRFRILPLASYFAKFNEVTCPEHIPSGVIYHTGLTSTLYCVWLISKALRYHGT